MANPRQRRDSHGRFKADHRTRNRSLFAGAALAAGAGLAAAIWRGWVKMPRAPWMDEEEGHEAPDLALDAARPGTDRAPEDFRPDPEAIPTDAEREALKPASVH
ncbi:MAG: hypothetical protein ACTHJR_17305 [Sphingomonas sp.]|uniref:hypothetical protein n=1 Tax=Sphingomonas sp. TaxID=28214 RepID=UPI003F7FF8B8